MTQQPIYRASGVVGAGGTLSVPFSPRGGQPVRVTQVANEMAAGVGALCLLRLDGALISPLVPTYDAAGGDPPIWVQPGSLLTVNWSGAPVGVTGSITVIYDDGSA